MEGIDFGWIMNAIAEPWPASTSGAPSAETAGATRMQEPTDQSPKANKDTESKNGDTVDRV